MPAGRPTKYTPELLDMAENYLKNWESEGRFIPSNLTLARILGIGTSTLYDWANDKDKKRFSDILERINDLQHEVLLNNGLSGEFNSTITKLVLGKHGYSEKQEVSAENKEVTHVTIEHVSAKK